MKESKHSKITPPGRMPNAFKDPAAFEEYLDKCNLAGEYVEKRIRERELRNKSREKAKHD